MRTPIIVGLLIRIGIAPFTSLSGDVAIWWQTATRAMQGIGLYQFQGFSYPPLYGYWALAVGGVAHWTGVSQSSFGGVVPQLIQNQIPALGAIVTTPIGTLLFKLPMIAADLVTGWCIWRVANKLGASPRQARFVFLLWFLNPLVIFVSAVQGQIDSLAALGIAAAILGAAEETWAAAGAAIAIGVAAKIIPGFLIFPFLGFIVGRSPKDRFKNLVRFVAGGLIAGVVLFGPIVGHGFLQNVFTRTSVNGGNLGGLGLFGLLHLPALFGVLTWMQVHFITVNRLLTAIEILLSIGLGFWTGKYPRLSTLVMASTLCLSIVIFLNPVTNPQYLLWVMPLVALGAAGLTRGRRILQGSLAAITVGGLGYLLGFFGWAFFLAPSSIYLGWPSRNSLASQQQFLARVSGPRWLPATVSGKVSLVSCLVIICAIIGVASSSFVRQRLQLPESSLSTTPPRRIAKNLILVAATILLFEVVGGASPYLVGSPKFSAAVTHRESSIYQVTVANPSRVNLRAVAFPISAANGVRNVFFYRSSEYPYSGSSDASVIGIYQNLDSELSLIAPQIRLQMVDAVQLMTAIAQDPDPRQTLIVDVSGTLPNTVWGANGTGPLLPWIKSGGRLAFGGDVPGYYSVGIGTSLTTTQRGRVILSPNVVVVGVKALLPSGIIGSVNSNRPQAFHTSSWGAALGLSYSNVSIELSSRAITAKSGRILGFSQGKLASEAFVPVGGGGVLVFAGPAGPDQTSPISLDLARLLATNWFASGRSVAAQTTNSRSVNLRVHTKSRSTPIEVAIFDPSRPLSLWTRELP